jgi:hypothetical protein
MSHSLSLRLLICNHNKCRHELSPSIKWNDTLGCEGLKGLMKDVSGTTRKSMYTDIRSTISSSAGGAALGPAAMYGKVNNTNLAKLSNLGYHQLVRNGTTVGTFCSNFETISLMTFIMPFSSTILPRPAKNRNINFALTMSPCSKSSLIFATVKSRTSFPMTCLRALARRNNDA